MSPGGGKASLASLDREDCCNPATLADPAEDQRVFEILYFAGPLGKPLPERLLNGEAKRPLEGMVCPTNDLEVLSWVALASATAADPVPMQEQEAAAPEARPVATQASAAKSVAVSGLAVLAIGIEYISAARPSAEV